MTKKLYAVKLADGSWWSPFGPFMCASRVRLACANELKTHRDSLRALIKNPNDDEDDIDYLRSELAMLRSARIVVLTPADEALP